MDKYYLHSWSALQYGFVYIYIYIYIYTLLLFNIAMENPL